MTLFVRITIALAALLIALAIVAFIIKAIFVAATLAVVALGALFAVNFVRAFARRQRDAKTYPISKM